jgi:hypothetical protein
MNASAVIESLNACDEQYTLNELTNFQESGSTITTQSLNSIQTFNLNGPATTYSTFESTAFESTPTFDMSTITSILIPFFDNTSTLNSTTTSISTKKKRKLYSWVWDHFKHSNDKFHTFNHCNKKVLVGKDHYYKS